MNTYTIRKIYHYTTTVEVQAQTEREALELSDSICGESNNDDYLHDAEVVSVSADESQEER